MWNPLVAALALTCPACPLSPLKRPVNGQQSLLLMRKSVITICVCVSVIIKQFLMTNFFITNKESCPSRIAHPLSCCIWRRCSRLWNWTTSVQTKAKDENLWLCLSDKHVVLQNLSSIWLPGIVRRVLSYVFLFDANSWVGWGHRSRVESSCIFPPPASFEWGSVSTSTVARALVPGL